MCEAEEPAIRSTRGGGGVWEIVLDHAALQVAQHLASRECAAFDSSSDVARSMLQLLDRRTLRSVVRERNASFLCGMFGCCQLPRGLRNKEYNASKDATDASRPCAQGFSTCDDDSIDSVDDDEEEEATQTEDMATTPADSNEDIIYEDDIYTAESFRLAMRDSRQLRRVIKRQQQSARKQPLSISLEKGQRGIGIGAQAESPHHLLAMRDRFCSDWCFDRYESEVKSVVTPFLEYAHPNLVKSVSYLFPNLRLDVLQQLTTAEGQGSPLLHGVVERNVQFKSKSTAGVARAASAATTENPPLTSEEQSSAPTLQTLLHAMTAVRCVWKSALAAPDDISGSSQQKRPAESFKWSDGAASSSSAPAIQTGTTTRPQGVLECTSLSSLRGSLRGSLLVHDFLMNICGARCGNMMMALYAVHRCALRKLMSAVPPREGNAFDRVIRKLWSRAEEKWAEVATEMNPTEPLRVDAELEDHRRALLGRHMFSTASTSSLSRLLLFDENSLYAYAWNGVWLCPAPVATVNGLEHRAGGGAVNAFSTLVFPFSIPSRVLEAMDQSPEALELGIVFILAAACVHPDVLEEFLLRDAQLDDVIDALHLRPEDLTAAVRLILLP